MSLQPPSKCSRCTATSFRRTTQKRPNRSSPSFYTSRASYYDHLTNSKPPSSAAVAPSPRLELLPLPSFAPRLPPTSPTSLAQPPKPAPMFSNALQTARYRRIIAVLADLEECGRIASAAGHTPPRREHQARSRALRAPDKVESWRVPCAKHVPLDRYGRSYTVGKRKESAARVWIIPVSRTYCQYHNHIRSLARCSKVATQTQISSCQW